MEITDELIFQAAVLVFAVAGIATLWSAFITRRHRKQLDELAKRYSLARVEGEVRKSAHAMAGRFGRRQRRVRLSDVYMGEDEDGRFYLARRRIGRHRQQILFFDLESTSRISEFHIQPLPEPKLRKGVIVKTRSENDWTLRLDWRGRRSQWADESSLGFGARIVGHVARLGAKPGATMLGVEVHDHWVLVHSLHALRGNQLNRCFQDTLQLRRLVMAARHRMEAHATRRMGSQSTEVPPELVKVL